MKLLLTSGGISNRSIEQALIDLLGKPIEESSALCIPTGIYPFSSGPEYGWKFAAGKAASRMVDLPWKSMGLLEPSVLPSIDKDVWQGVVRAADAILVFGGATLFLHYWFTQSGLADFFNELPDTVYVGWSAGSMVMTPSIGEEFIEWWPPSHKDEALGIVPFSIFPHLDVPWSKENSMAHAEIWAAKMPNTSYAIDDDTAIKVVDGEVEVISEGNWVLFNG